jgi:L-alanine-DL-glutamate epimerase-like enolase superfamily enzyme
MHTGDLKKIRIESVSSNFEREPLIRPFGFKGNYLTGIWQTAAFLQSASGIKKVGLAGQSVLWSDELVYASHSESGGNALMFALTEYALRLVRGETFDNPIELQDRIFPEVYKYGVNITGNQGLRKTFVLNALVALDNAAWMLYAAENGITNFDDLIPEAYRMALCRHHNKVAAVPMIGYTSPVSEAIDAAGSGYFIIKIKIGHPGTQDEMLARDKERISDIHKAIEHYPTAGTASGRLLYYLDANGRYEKKDSLLKLIDHTKTIGAYDQIAIIEEPFPEHAEIDVHDVPLRIAADESAHTGNDVLARIQRGYKAIALKAVAKTLSMTMRMARQAKQHQIPCFCADLTANPILLDWNKNIAARLEPFPGLDTGLLECNGQQNYKNWQMMETHHPVPGASWRRIQNGVFNLNDDFYRKSGGVLTDSKHYMDLFTQDYS